VELLLVSGNRLRMRPLEEPPTPQINMKTIVKEVQAQLGCSSRRGIASVLAKANLCFKSKNKRKPLPPLLRIYFITNLQSHYLKRLSHLRPGLQNTLETSKETPLARCPADLKEDPSSKKL
jgi:hypothetical protein